MLDFEGLGAAALGPLALHCSMSLASGVASGRTPLHFDPAIAELFNESCDLGLVEASSSGASQLHESHPFGPDLAMAATLQGSPRLQTLVNALKKNNPQTDELLAGARRYLHDLATIGAGALSNAVSGDQICSAVLNAGIYDAELAALTAAP